MLHTLKDLARFRRQEGKIIFEGSGGSLELGLPVSGAVSVFYRLDGVDDAAIPGVGEEPHPGLLAPGLRSAAPEDWDAIEEGPDGYGLRHGDTRVFVEKAGARVDVYVKDRLVHGGEIGPRDLVASRQPLRVQAMPQGGRAAARFRFRLEEGDAFFGLGEKSGALDKRGRSFRMSNRDALAYDARYSDPLYKSVPFLLRLNRGSGAACGLFFPSLRVEGVDLGVESRFFYGVELSGGPLGYYVLTGGGYREILSAYFRLAGLPALPPFFSFGYLASSMGYTDPDDAEERVLGFFERVEEEDIPCEGMYFSSGYAKADNGERYTFAWNSRKFPDPAAFLGGLLARGYRVCCNVKPGLLVTHPRYSEAAAAGALVPGAEGGPLVSYYWGNNASFVDFSRKEGREWWIENLGREILAKGASGVWNDNNEFEVEDGAEPVQGLRSILPVLMAEASYEAMRRARPGKRPWNISRSGYAGLQRYARTWTGDNVSDWTTMEGNIAMGMNLGLSGLPIYGHDIGGFVGPPPDEELLLRWCQSAIFQPRFVMHSWKPDGWITEPWSYPGSLAAIRGFIRERYRFLPYLYDLAIRASETGAPMESPVALDFPEDPALGLESLDRMAGEAVLVPAPPPRGRDSGSVRLPAGTDWFDPVECLMVHGGRDYGFAYPADRPRQFFRCGSVIPTAAHIVSVGKGVLRDYRFEVLPAATGGFLSCVHCEDDGESDFLPGSHWRFRMECREEGEERHRLVVRREGEAAGLAFARTWRFRVPAGFSFVDEADRVLGAELTFSFGDAPEVLELRFKGAYQGRA
jgi:alpha-glucosidase